MVMTWGFGIEKETAFVGYNKPLKDFTSEASTISHRYSHDESEMFKLGDYAREIYDGTVYDNHEFISVRKHLKGLPKNTILGFIKDTENRAKTKIRASRQYKRTIPFGSIPGKGKASLGGLVPGSYHFNITFPYDKDIPTLENRRDYEKKLKIGLLNVRVIQPLILAMLGGTDSDSIGNPKNLEGSFRQAYSSDCSSIAYAKLDESEDTVFKAISHKMNNPGYESHNRAYDNGYGRSPTNNNVNWRRKIGNVPGFATGRSFFTDFRIKAFRSESVPTIEFRFLDTFDTRGTYGVLGVISCAMANGGRVGSFSDPENNDVWNDAMVDIIKEGWNSFVDKSYATYIERKLKVKLDVVTPKIRADLLFYKVLDELWKKNKNDDWVKHWFDDKPEVHNFNKDSWEFYLIMMFVNNENFKKKMIRFLEILNKINSSASGGWIKVNYKDNKYAVRDLILDDEVMGSEYGFEDTEDIIHFLHRYEILNIKEDKSGRIVDVKTSFSDIEELNKKLEKIFNEDKMLNGDEGLIKSEEVANFIPVTPPTPRVRRDPRQTSVEPLSGNIKVEVQSVSEEERYFADDFEEVINGANLMYNSRRLRMRVEYATMHTSNGHYFDRPFWKARNLYVPLSFRELDQPSLWVDLMKSLKWWTYDRVSNRTIKAVPYDGYEDDFFTKLEQEALNEYAKDNETIITNRAGIIKLHDKGIVIVSFKRGKHYKLIKLRNFRAMRSSLHPYNDFKSIKYIPYQKGYVVKRRANKFTLLKNNKPVSILEVN